MLTPQVTFAPSSGCSERAGAGGPQSPLMFGGSPPSGCSAPKSPFLQSSATENPDFAGQAFVFMQDLHKQLCRCFLPPQRRGVPWPGPVQREMLTDSGQGPCAHVPGCGHARGVGAPGYAGMLRDAGMLRSLPARG